MPPLTEKWRPTSFDEVAGQPKAVKTCRALVARGLGGRAVWLSGGSGTGKSTLARLLAAEMADETFVEELDASALTVSQLRDLEREMAFRGWGKGGRAYLVNEAHGMRKDVIRQLLVLLERLPAHVLVVFTTTVEGQGKLFDDCDDASPLLSRCLRIDLARRDLAKPFAERARQIAQAEGLDGFPVERYITLMQKHRNNLRAAIQEIEAGGMMKGEDE